MTNHSYLSRLRCYCSALAGNADAQYRVAQQIEHNNQPDREARVTTWLSRAAHGGHADAALQLATRALQTGDTSSAVQILEQFNRLHTNHDVNALLGQILLNQSTEQEDITRLTQETKTSSPYPTTSHRDTEIGRLRERALDLLQQAANQEQVLAVHALAVYYLQQHPAIKHNNQTEKALQQLQRNCDKGFAPSMQVMAGIYENGLYGIDSDVQAGLNLRVKAAQTGSKESQFYLGCMIYQGNGFECSREQGLDLIQRAATRGHKPAQSFLDHIKNQ